tara:strand:- start:548 stop:769 length:222 start_codon:yes stop_codon:yes gene_type:complete
MKKEKTDLQIFQEWVQELNELVFGTPVKETTKTKPKRARTKKGTYRADDKRTKEVNEAWVGGKAPKKKKNGKK